MSRRMGRRMKPMTPTADDMARDLAADLALIDRHEKTWRIPLAWEGRTNYAYPEFARFEAHLPLVARSAIRRASAATARVKELEAELARRPAPPQTIRVLVNGRDATEDELDRIALSSLARPETPPHDMEIPPEDVEARGGMAYLKKGKQG